MKKETRAACPFCNLHCADLRLTFDGGRLVGFSPACSLGEAGYRSATGRLPAARDPGVMRTWLEESRQPMILLSGEVDCETAAAAVRLAKCYSAFLVCDEEQTGLTLGLAMQSAGCLTGTLGDLRGQALVVLCGVCPSHIPPRLDEFIGRDLVKDCLHLDPANPLDTLRRLRLAIRGNSDVLPPQLAPVAARIAAAPSGVLVFDQNWMTAGPLFAAELLLWLEDLNQQRRWYALYLPPAPNSIGVVETLLAETGYPGSLRFNSGGIDFAPRLWQAGRILEQGEADLCLLVGQPRPFSKNTLPALRKIRTILLSPERPAWRPSLWQPAARAGVDASGLVQRLDGTPVNLQALISSRRPAMKDLLSELVGKEVQV
jgi:formylmethanofuran dehydrogenase subunit B